MKKAELYIISTGMGCSGYLTQNALASLEKAELVVGYTKYIKDIEPLIIHKEIYSTGMTHETERCKYAVQQALIGKRTALISNGDVNVYGIAGLVLEIIENNNLWYSIEIIIEPGISAMFAAAAKTGAPIMNDFAVISLSNLLTPIEKIEMRLKNALLADFVLGIYNPCSHSRKEPYLMFLDLLKETRNPETPVIIAQNLGRGTEKICVETMERLLEIKDNSDVINMSTILIIGNSTTKLANSGQMVINRRGYEKVYDYTLENQRQRT